MAPRVPGLSALQTRALRILALGGQTMALGRTRVRFTSRNGVHIDLPWVAVKERFVDSGLVRDMGSGDYRITAKGKVLSDGTAREYKKAWEERIAKKKAESAPAKPWREHPAHGEEGS